MPGRDRRLGSDLSSKRLSPPKGGSAKVCPRKGCPAGGRPQLLTAFPHNRTRSDGRDQYCHPCRATYEREKVARRKAKQLAERRAEGRAVDRRTPRPNGLDPDALTRKLFEITKKGPISFSVLCDRLDMSPAKTKDAIKAARDQGIQLKVEHDHVGFAPQQAEDRVQNVGIAPVIGERQRVGVISDTHLGSKFCLRPQLVEFIHYAYQEGVREILHVGDVTDGDYRHGKFEMSHMGLDAQAQDLFEVLPQLPGLTYHAITGNHDYTFTEQSGVDVGKFLEGYFRERGRSDLRFYGNRGAFLKVRGAVVHLWHPRSGVSYARSYALQKHIEKYSSGEKPNILLAGHWHVYCHVFERGVHALACPTFQGGGSAFSKSLGGAPAIGGMILSWDLTEHGTLRSFVHEYRAYFEVEKPQQVQDDTAYLEEIAVTKGKRARR